MFKHIAFFFASAAIPLQPAQAQDSTTQLTITASLSREAFATTLSFSTASACKAAARPLLIAHDLGADDRSAATCTNQEGKIIFQVDCRWTLKEYLAPTEEPVSSNLAGSILACKDE